SSWLEAVSRSVGVVCRVQTGLQNIRSTFGRRFEHCDFRRAVASVVKMRTIDPVVVRRVLRIQVMDRMPAFEMIRAGVLPGRDVIAGRAVLVANGVTVVVVVLKNVGHGNALSVGEAGNCSGSERGGGDGDETQQSPARLVEQGSSGCRGECIGGLSVNRSRHGRAPRSRTGSCVYVYTRRTMCTEMGEVSGLETLFHNSSFG